MTTVRLFRGELAVASFGEPRPYEVAADLAQSARAVRRDLSHLRRTLWTAISAARSIVSWSRGLPRLDLPVSSDLAGDAVLAGLAFCQPWPVRYRAVAVISLPRTFEQYLRGRSMQAVRTNRARALARGLTVMRAGSGRPAMQLLDIMLERHTFEVTVDESFIRHVSAGVAQIWFVLSPQGTPIGAAAVAVDRGVAQLAALQIAVDVDDRSDARFLLSTEVVRELIAEARDYLVADSMLLSRPGVVYLQRRLGFEPVQIVVSRRIRWRQVVRGLRGRRFEATSDPAVLASPRSSAADPTKRSANLERIMTRALLLRGRDEAR